MLNHADLFWISTVRADGRPHVTPLVAIWLDDAIHFATRLEKSVEQPWFEPFAAQSSRWPKGLRLHRDGLKRIMRTDRHDREEIWFVLSDGSNIEAMVADALRAIREAGLPWLEISRATAVRDYEQQVREGLV